MKLSKPWRIALRILAGVAVAFCLAFAIGVYWVSHHAREFVVNSLHRQFHADVQIESFEMKMYPAIQVTGSGLVMHLPGREDLPPLISVQSFSAQTRWSAMLVRHISHVTLVGLQITVPTGQPADVEGQSSSNLMGRLTGVLMDDVQTVNAKITILPKDASKQPEVIDVASFQAHSLSADGKMQGHATVRSIIPPGDILADVTFGPWDGDVPARTPVSGTFSFQNADLSTLPGGVAGTLSTEGHLDGMMERIAADGSAKAPDFSLKTSEHPVDLTAKFHVIIDGAEGETRIDHLEAHFLHSTLAATGTVAGTPGQQGKAVKLDLSAMDARVEDILALTNKDQPAMTGNIGLNTTFVLPAGPQNDPMNQMVLSNGSFNIDEVVFTSQSVEKNVNKLSMRSRGNTGDMPADQNVASEMRGRFEVQSGVMTFSELTFHVPGAHVRMIGTLGLANQTFGLHGMLDMDAPLSQTTTGVGSFLLKAVQPLFSKPGGGTRVFFMLLGTEKNPIYSLDLHHKDLENTLNPSANQNITADASGH